MAESKKPRICEILGVNVGEVWAVDGDGTRYRVDEDGVLLYQTPTGTWVDAYSRAWCVIAIINGCAKIIRQPGWTAEDIADAKAVRRLWPHAIGVEKAGDFVGVEVPGFRGRNYIKNAGLFPSLMPGDSAALDKILEAWDDAACERSDGHG